MSLYQNQLSILQYNTRKLRIVIVELFKNARTYNIDIIAIQELWRSLYISLYYRLKDRFDLVYLYYEDTRVCFYINKRIPKAKWYLSYQGPDLCSLNVKIENERILRIYNIYNPGG